MNIVNNIWHNFFVVVEQDNTCEKKTKTLRKSVAIHSKWNGIEWAAIAIQHNHRRR